MWKIPAGVVGLALLAGCSTSGGEKEPPEPPEPSALAECDADAKLLKTAVVAWNTMYLSGDDPATYPTPYPTSERALAGDLILKEEVDAYDLEGGGDDVPLLVPAGDCPEAEQLD